MAERTPKCVFKCYIRLVNIENLFDALNGIFSDLVAIQELYSDSKENSVMKITEANKHFMSEWLVYLNEKF